MVRALILAALIYVCGIHSSSTAESRTADSSPTRATTTSSPTLNTNTVVDDGRYHPADVPKPRVLEERDQRYLDGNYEYRYVLSNGVTRYEKSYWSPVGKGKQVLARKGFYSHPLTNNKYITVFYTADEKGYHQDSLKYTENLPILPKHLEVPEHEFPIETSRPTRATTTTTTTTRKPKTTTTRKSWTTTRKSVVKPSKFNWIY